MFEKVLLQNLQTIFTFGSSTHPIIGVVILFPIPPLSLSTSGGVGKGSESESVWRLRSPHSCPEAPASRIKAHLYRRDLAKLVASACQILGLSRSALFTLASSPVWSLRLCRYLPISLLRSS